MLYKVHIQNVPSKIPRSPDRILGVLSVYSASCSSRIDRNFISKVYLLTDRSQKSACHSVE